MPEVKETETKPTEKSVRVYNRSTRRTFIHEGHRLAPSSFLDVPESVAKRWLKMFEGEIAEGGVAQKELAGAQAELAAKDAKIKELEAALAAAKAGGPKQGGGKPSASEQV